ncbi:unnamed protein product [Euphydryas editha]|uniref:RING-type domain-containing protein n=1 Tax=Euphydryas editha TaxID=104508 RepID=A0AAU9VFV0_EUPED|nr:unnamed protein product [Euphydryas editha]
MVTSNKQSDKKVVKMAEQNNIAVVPQRTLLGEVNEHITCPLCRGYYIDATTIVECLHSFCRSCIIKHLQVKSYCPVCEMMINSAKPNIKLDKALQDIVYKLVPGLFQKEMERRQHFYSSRPGPAASATPEQRGEDTERIIFSPEDVISFSLEYADATDADSISSKSSDSNEAQPSALTTRRYLQCPAVVNISHLKKFLSMKFDIDSTQFAIDILYKRVPLPDYYTLMDIAYIYNWKRNEPMRFFYQIIDYVAIRNRLFDINRKGGSHFPDRKSSPTCTEDTNASSPTPNLNDQASEASSGTDSPMPDETNVKKTCDNQNKSDSSGQSVKDVKDVAITQESKPVSKKNDDEVEKSQFLNSFELKANNNPTSSKSSPVKASNSDAVTSPKDNSGNKNSSQTSKIEECLKRKYEIPKTLPEMKKIKIEIPKVPINQTTSAGTTKILNVKENSQKVASNSTNLEKTIEDKSKISMASANIQTAPLIPVKDNKQQQTSMVKQQQQSDSPGQKRTVAVPHAVSSPKRKPSDSSVVSQPSTSVPKTVSPLKLQIPKPEAPTPTSKPVETPKTTTKKMPDLKPSIPVSSTQNKQPPSGKLRMDLLANNSDPTIDRSKILSQVKTSLPNPNMGQPSGDPLKSLFDSCKINIPSSLSITLTDQKLDPRNLSDTVSNDPKKTIVNKNLTSASNTSTHKVPSPPVHNYIEILKLPDTDPKKSNKVENIADKNNSIQNKIESNTTQTKLPTKTSETSAKGPIPNLKPIADTKLGKQSGTYSTAPITFQQTFEQQLQSFQSEKKPKVPKNKAQVPKLVPATPKSFSAANKLNSVNKTTPNVPPVENKASTALDLSTPHNIQSQLGPQQTKKAFEKMQSIANLANKQNMHPKMLPLAMSQANVFTNMPNRTLTTGAQTLRVPSTSSINQMKLDKLNTSGSQMTSPRHETTQRNPIKHAPNSNPNVPPSYSNNSPSNAQPSPRSQTRSPSSSPKLVIAEDKQANNLSSEYNINQSNQITSTQLSNANPSKIESPKASPGPSKTGLKPVKPIMPGGKVTGIRQPITPSINANPGLNSPADFLSKPQLISPAHQAMLRHQMEMQNAWLNAQRQYDLIKNISNMAHQTQNEQ